MKRRNIKKNLQYVMNDMLTATLVALADKSTDTDKVAEIQTRIISVYQDYNSRLSNYERHNAHAFFAQFKKSLNAELEAIVAEIEKL
ncbi:MAG: hypothetical protein IJ139_07845 [Bacteroidaceae bacterium]|jgi:uncharacterized protein YeeX (DUF496 family)|nr:hypothetical protein [Bacteroidaceae bacterium]MBQ9176765.1 hypothetical protein [Bacteroidaceae bacterium]MBR1379713.1 hypothetical protein [Bacteroidaceae bacterium]